MVDKGAQVEQLNEEERQLAAVLTAARGRAANGDIQGLLDLEGLAKSGSSEAMIVLAEEYVGGPFVDLAKAERWFRTAYQVSPTNLSTFQLGRFLNWQERDEEAKEVFANGARRGFGLSMYWLAVIYLRETPRGSHYPPEARQLLEAASAQGYVWATRRLASMLVKGKFGLADVPRGVALFFLYFKQFIPTVLKDPHDLRLRR